MNNVSLCLTTYNRFDEFQKTLSYAISEPRISEIIISDDGSRPEFQERLRTITNPKVKLFFNNENVGPFKNKTLSIERATNEWVLLFDSDDVLTVDYLDALENVKDFNPKTLYCPEYGICVRNGMMTNDRWEFTPYLGEPQTLDTIRDHAIKGTKHCSAFLNTCVYITNRAEYLRVVKPYLDIVFYNDAIHLKYIWLLYGNECRVVPNMFYYHHSGHRTSFYWSFKDDNEICSDKIMKSIVDGTEYNFKESKKND